MSPLLAMLAAPPAIAALDAARGAASAVARPFADVLGALADQTQPAAVIPDEQGENADLKDRVAARLQAILEAAGAEPGDCSSVSYDDATGRVEVNDGAPSGDKAQAAIEADQQLLDDLQQMAEADGDPSSRLDLLVQIA